MTITESTTIGDLVDWVNREVDGISASFSDGKLTLTGSDSTYINWLDSNFASLFNLAYGQDKTFKVTTQTQKIVTPNNFQTSQLYTGIQINQILYNNDTTLGDLGLEGEGTVSILTKEGVSRRFTVDSSTTFAEFNRLLGDGVSFTWNSSSTALTLAGTEQAWITSMSDNLESALNITVGLNKSYSNTSSGKANAVSDRQVVVSTGQSGDTSAYHTTYSNKTIGSIFVLGTGAAEGGAFLIKLFIPTVFKHFRQYFIQVARRVGSIDTRRM